MAAPPRRRLTAAGGAASPLLADLDELVTLREWLGAGRARAA